MRRLPSLLALALVASLPVAPALAASFVVDTTSDTLLSDCDPGVAQDCSLRGAITAANANADADQIAFDLSESDPGYQAETAHWRFAPATALPDVQTGALTIDGFTQPGAQPNTNPPLFPIGHTLKIELRGPNPSSVNCLQANFVPLTVRGLALNNCNQAVYLFEGASHVIEGNHIGTDITGQTAVLNRFGVALGGDVLIGGTLPSQGNVISGNSRGALVQFRPISRLRVQGNIIGPDNTLTAVPGLQDYGVQLSSAYTDVLIGGATPAEANTISGNGFNAISISDNAQAVPGAPNVRVFGNLIGVGIGGQPLGNGLNPGSPSQTLPSIQIGLLGYCRAQIGGEGPGEGNLIAYGGNVAIAVSSCWNAPLLGNAFLSNSRAPIDLAGSSGFDGPSANDPGDIDGGSDPLAVAAGNRLQNTVHVDAVVEDAAAGELRVTLRVDSLPTASSYPLRLDLYRIDEFGIQSPAETQEYALADAQLPREYILSLDTYRRGVGITVTDAGGNTSELLTVGPIFADGFEGESAGGD